MNKRKRIRKYLKRSGPRNRDQIKGSIKYMRSRRRR